MSAGTGTQNSNLKTNNTSPSRKKKISRHLGTFGDIWGLMSHFHAKTRGPRPRKTKASNDRYVKFTYAENGADNQENQDGRRRVARIETLAPKGEAAKEGLSFSPSRLPPNWMVRPSAAAPWSSKRLRKRAPEPLSHAICRSPRGCYRVHALLSTA